MGFTKVGVIQKLVPNAPKLYVFQEINSAYLFCKLPCVFFFVGEKVDTDHFKYDIIPSLKIKDRFKFSPDAAMNHL